MPADIDTMRLLEHIDGKFAEADRKRAEGLSIVHAKIDDHAREARESLGEFRSETTAALGTLSVEIGKHDTRIEAIEAKASAEATRADGWWKTGAAIVFGGGSLATLLEWLRNGGGKG